MYAYSLELALPMDQAIEKLREILMSEKMGVVAEIDAQAVLKAKIDHDIPPYRVLGICAPMIAKRVLAADGNGGALLPCGCAVRYIDANRTGIALQNPDMIAAAVDNAEIRAAMSEVKATIERVVDKLKALA